MIRTLCALLLSFGSFLPQAFAGTLRVDILDIGQGDSVLVRTPGGKTILIDAGDGGVDVPPILAREGVTALDLVVATHPHADHIGGMADVLKVLPVKVYTDNGLPHTTATYQKVMSEVETRKIAYRAAVRDQVYNLDDGAKLEVLFPNGVKLSNTRSDLNSNSVVTRLTHQGHCMLFTGDSEEPTEQALLSAGLEKCDVLKVAHHGSRHSSTTAFLEAVKPRFAVVSLGVGNRYHHPGMETLQRLQAVGAEIHRTDLEGQLTILSSEKGLTVKVAHASVLPVTASADETEAKLGKPDKRSRTASSDDASPDDTSAGTRTHASGRSASGSPAAAAAGRLLDLNTATREQLLALPGIGPATADKILAYRQANGRFKTVDELDAVNGIGPAKLAQIRPLVTVPPAR
jgi:competence protein ComEC